MDKEKITAAVKKAATDGRLECREAFRLAGELGCDPLEIGKACNEAGIKVNSCQLGCF